MTGAGGHPGAWERKARDFFRWIDESHPDASVRWLGQDAETWGEMRPRWKRRRSRIFLTVAVHGRDVCLEVAAVRTQGQAAEVLLKGSAGRPAGAMVVCWGAPGGTGFRSWRDFPAQVERWLARKYPGARIRSAGLRPDRTWSLSGRFLRIRVRTPASELLVLAPHPEADPDIQRAAIAQMLLFLRAPGCGAGIGTVRRALVVLPDAFSQVGLHRSSLLDASRVQCEVWVTHGEVGAGGWSFRPAPAPRDPVEESDYHWPSTARPAPTQTADALLRLAPGLIRRCCRAQDYDSLRILGLEFARLTGNGRDQVLFGVGSEKQALTEENFASLRALVEEILFYRRPDSPNTQHPFYRLQGERWLESLILEDAERLFPEIAPGCLHSQVPVYLGGESGRVDLLGAGATGETVVMEIKIGEDPGMPVQALDYRARVLYHVRRGDFSARGYFGGRSLSCTPPTVYLVAPLFRFHDSTEQMLEWMDPSAEVWKIGLNQDWRAGIRVMRRLRLRPAGRGR